MFHPFVKQKRHHHKRRLFKVFFHPFFIGFILSVFSLSGCPRAKKGGLKTTPTKDDKEDSELLKFVPLKKDTALFSSN